MSKNEGQKDDRTKVFCTMTLFYHIQESLAEIFHLYAMNMHSTLLLSL